ncbi:MAG: acetyl-CoA carboxylase biotin carboxyl carrier protein subunit [Ignisphaera sp.]|nr:acetyl-CoA carboxylase biotin carboxyl carrier protein subunit [Ignisphaera sp.]MCX8167784.1 acetyl-CoA carboxylase biotin carboxyl carrier protein subunit [Ignisphaera sp.]MDW8085229.1 acetyl-CoA carboxylase biotin carboxyl carrier protein subunit [Ignisphaera sp.]
MHVIENGNDISTKLEDENRYTKVDEHVNMIQGTAALERHSLGENVICSEVPGRIVKVFVNEGDSINKGDTVAIVESMKMEIEIKSSRNGVVKKVFAKNGSYINVGQPIILLE